MAEIEPGPSRPLRELVNRSGFPFQLAVERTIRTTQRSHGFEVLGREFPWSEGFLDLLLGRNQVYLAIECKRVDSESWIFLMPPDQSARANRCRLEWYNGNASEIRLPSPYDSKLFCSEFNMVEGSPESDFCVVPKNSPIKTLEEVCRKLLQASHDILDDANMKHRFGWEVIVPVIVTNANLVTCEFDPSDAHLDAGKLSETEGRFAKVGFVRFRKSLAAHRSNTYATQPLLPEEWVSDAERTVFVVNARSLQHFFFGFRSFGPVANRANPAEYDQPPVLDKPDDSILRGLYAFHSNSSWLAMQRP